jgi:hypothetical protein
LYLKNESDLEKERGRETVFFTRTTVTQRALFVAQ